MVEPFNNVGASQQPVSIPSSYEDTPLRTPPATPPEYYETRIELTDVCCSCFSWIGDLITSFFSWLFSCSSSQEKNPDKPLENTITAHPEISAKAPEMVFDPMWVIQGEKAALRMIASPFVSDEKIPWNWILKCDFHAQLESIESLAERFFACDYLADQILITLREAVENKKFPISPVDAGKALDYCISLGDFLLNIKESSLVDPLNNDISVRHFLEEWFDHPRTVFSPQYIKDKIYRHFQIYHKDKEQLQDLMLQNYHYLFVKINECRPSFTSDRWKNSDWHDKLPSA